MNTLSHYRRFYQDKFVHQDQRMRRRLNLPLGEILRRRRFPSPRSWFWIKRGSFSEPREASPYFNNHLLLFLNLANPITQQLRGNEINCTFFVHAQIFCGSIKLRKNPPVCACHILSCCQHALRCMTHHYGAERRWNVFKLRNAR